MKPDDEIAALKRQVAALADFITTLSAALITSQPLAKLAVEAMVKDSFASSQAGQQESGKSESDIASLANDVLIIAGYRPVPSPIRFVYSADYGV